MTHLCSYVLYLWLVKVAEFVVPIDVGLIFVRALFERNALTACQNPWSPVINKSIMYILYAVRNK